MQTRVVINKIRWIRSQLTDELEDWLFSSRGSTSTGDVIRDIVEATRFAELVSRDAAAVQILHAFGLHPLVDREELYEWFHEVTGPRSHRSRTDVDEEGEHREEPLSDPVAVAWKNMIGFVDPIEKLTTPEEMRTPELPETFISFELASMAAGNTPLSRLSKATVFAEKAYETVCRVYQIKGNGTLTVVKVESGSGITIDCKGLGEPIKHLKDLILEAWHKIRHKRADEVLENNKAILESLAVIKRIKAREKDESLSREEAERLRRNVITSVCGLFECGVLIAEIPSQETVENTKLLDGFVPKRLLPPAADSKAGTKKAARKKTTPKKRSSTRRKN